MARPPDPTRQHAAARTRVETSRKGWRSDRQERGLARAFEAVTSWSAMAGVPLLRGLWWWWVRRELAMIRGGVDGRAAARSVGQPSALPQVALTPGVCHTVAQCLEEWGMPCAIEG